MGLTFRRKEPRKKMTKSIMKPYENIKVVMPL